MFDFENGANEESLEYEGVLLQALVDFVYLGCATVQSHLLVNVLDMSHKYLLGSLKAYVETIFAGNISVENYLDTYMVA